MPRALPLQPPMGCRSRHGSKATSERPLRHSSALRHGIHRVLLGYCGAKAVQQLRECVFVGVARYGLIDVLLLAAFSMWRHDQAPGDGVGNGGAEVSADQMKAHVDSGRAACRGDDVAFVGVQDVRVDGDLRVTAREGLGIGASGSLRACRRVTRTPLRRRRRCKPRAGEPPLRWPCLACAPVPPAQAPRRSANRDDDGARCVEHPQREGSFDANAPCRLRGPSSTRATRSRYQRSYSGRDSPKSSTTMPNSNVHSPS